jgi:hypothetical protein
MADETFENLQLRFHLASVLNRMPYGRSRVIKREQAVKAWPPTGDHAPRTFENDFRALALANGGNRPETSYTTLERITNDLDGSFDVREDLVSGDWYIHRRDRDCPKCHGRKHISQREYTMADLRAGNDIEISEAITVTSVPCDCLPVRD